MKEILISGNPTKDFERLGVNPVLTYGDDETDYRVYEVSEEEFKILCDEPENENIWENCGWRHCEGSNQGVVNSTLMVNNKELKCWYNPIEDEEEIEEDTDTYVPEYNNLLEYLCNEMGCSAFRNVCALTKDLAKYNNMLLSELFREYQS